MLFMLESANCRENNVVSGGATLQPIATASNRAAGGNLIVGENGAGTQTIYSVLRFFARFGRTTVVVGAASRFKRASHRQRPCALRAKVRMPAPV